MFVYRSVNIGHAKLQPEIGLVAVGPCIEIHLLPDLDHLPRQTCREEKRVFFSDFDNLKVFVGIMTKIQQPYKRYCFFEQVG